MDDKERRRYEMLRRVRDFGVENAADFPAGSMGARLFASLGRAVASLENVSGERAENRGSQSQNTERKANAREELREDLRAIAVTARSIAAGTTSDFERMFRLPRSNNDAELLAAARGFATAAAAHTDEFVEYGLPADFIEDLNADIAAFEQSDSARNTATQAGVAATAMIDEKLESGTTALRQLEAIVRNKYRNAPDKLAAWTSATHVERSPRKPAAPTPQQ